jgi:hypothetical protein
MVAVVAVLCCAIAGCGSSASPAGPSSAQRTELSYLSPGAPLVLQVATSPQSAGVRGLDQLLGGEPDAAILELGLRQKLSAEGIDYDTDIKPLLGNPIGVSLDAASLHGERQNVTAVWVTANAGKLQSLIGKVHGLSRLGSHDGATLYGNDSTVLAVQGATVVIGSSTASVDAALDRHAHGGGFSAADFSKLTSGLPSGALIEAAGDLTQVLSQPSAARARRVPWVAALDGYGVALSANSTGLTLGFRLDTGAGTLTNAELPIAAGGTAPDLAGSLPIVVGLNDPRQAWSFITSAVQATDPSSWAKFAATQARAKARTGSDLQDLISLFTGSAILESDTHSTLFRVTVSDPAKATEVLTALAKAPGAGLQSGATIRSLGGGAFALSFGARVLTIALFGNQLVVGRAPVAALRTYAAAPARPASGTPGSLAFRIALGPLLAIRAPSSSQIMTAAFQALGNLVGSAQATTAATTGNASLAISSGAGG